MERAQKYLTESMKYQYPLPSLLPTSGHLRCSLGYGHNLKLSMAQHNKGLLLAHRADLSLRRALLHSITQVPWLTVSSILNLHHLKLLVSPITATGRQTAIGCTPSFLCCIPEMTLSLLFSAIGQSGHMVLREQVIGPPLSLPHPRTCPTPTLPSS